MIFRESFNALFDSFKVRAQSHHSLLRLHIALSLSLIEDIIVADGRTDRKENHKVRDGTSMEHRDNLFLKYFAVKCYDKHIKRNFIQFNCDISYSQKYLYAPRKCEITLGKR